MKWKSIDMVSYYQDASDNSAAELMDHVIEQCGDLFAHGIWMEMALGDR